MDVFDLVIAIYHLLVRAVALALNDAEFQADWAAVEAELEKLGVDVPGYPGPASQSTSSGAASQGVVTNPDGSVSLGES